MLSCTTNQNSPNLGSAWQRYKDAVFNSTDGSIIGASRNAAGACTSIDLLHQSYSQHPVNAGNNTNAIIGHNYVGTTLFSGYMNSDLWNNAEAFNTKNQAGGKPIAAATDSTGKRASCQLVSGASLTPTLLEALAHVRDGVRVDMSFDATGACTAVRYISDSRYLTNR